MRVVKGRPRKIDPENALQAAMLIFWEKGYYETSMADLVAATGMAKPGLYATFGDKENLYLKALQRYAATHGRPIAEKLMASEKPAKQAFRDLFMSLVEKMFDEDTPDGCFLCNTLMKSENNEPAIKTLGQEYHNLRREVIFKYLTKAKVSGLLPEKNEPALLADFIVAQTLTLAVMHKTGASRDKIVQFIDALLEIVKD